jgi:MoaA/NifB/PqqE/SkfB family radical SAM enzyme
MCTNPDDFKNSPYYDLETLLERYKRLDADEPEISLTGGEPTLQPHFFDFLEFLKKKCAKAKITIVTNGRLLAYPEFARKCLAFGNMEFHISLHGANERIHDGITMVKGSFKQTLQGIRNILQSRKHPGLELRIIIHKATLPYLADIFKFMAGNFPQAKNIAFIFMEMEGMAGKNIKKIGLKYSSALSALEKIYPLIGNSPVPVRFYHFPLCVLPPKFWPYAWRTLPPQEIFYPGSCEKCYYKKYCLGIHKHYAMHMGLEEFRPLKKIKNNFGFTDDPYHPINLGANK